MNHDDDLTASHWDDLVTPNTRSYGDSFDPHFNGFSDLNIHDKDQQDQQTDEEEDEQEESNTQPDHYSSGGYTGSAYDTAKSELDQIHQIKKDERNVHKSQLISELTKDDNFDELESSMISPTKIENHDSLFKDVTSPIKVDMNAKPQELNVSKAAKGSKKLFKRPRKYSSQKVVKHLSNDKSTEDTGSGNLGPLALDFQPPTSVSKSNPKSDLLRESEAPLYDIKSDQQKDEETRKQVKSNLPPTPRFNNESNKPLLDISVSDPMKVGDITNAHIIYTITTKLKDPKNTQEPKILEKDEPYVVTRRYKDFRWIYHQLQNNHLGKIIPPPPSKQTYIGRFNESFIENRRLSLEKMLNKISSISNLSRDDDFLMFLTSEDFGNESKERERVSGSGASLQNNDSLDNDNIFDTNVDTSSGNGFMSSIFSMSNKIDEPDEFFDTKRHYIETLEINLKNFYKAIETIINQRVELVNVVEQIIVTIEELTTIEINKQTTDLLVAFNDIQIKLKDNLDRVNLQDHLTLGFTIEEYLRIIGSIKYILDQRLKIYQTYQNYQGDLNKKKSSLNKYKSKNAVDKINQLNFEVDKLQARTTSFEKKFNSISEVIKQELENFEFEKIDDFRNSVEIFIESSIESQKESIELWETFYERQGLSKY